MKLDVVALAVAILAAILAGADLALTRFGSAPRPIAHDRVQDSYLRAHGQNLRDLWGAQDRAQRDRDELRLRLLRIEQARRDAGR